MSSYKPNPISLAARIAVSEPPDTIQAYLTSIATGNRSDAYALAQRSKTNTGNQASKSDAPRNARSELDDLRAPVRIS